MTHRVLIIDDDRSFRKLLEISLRDALDEMDLTCFENLSDARQFLKGAPPHFDLIVLDQHLPDGRGVDFLQEGWFENRAVLTVSSDDAPDIPGASLQAGAAYFLAKTRIREPLFKPLVQGIIDRNRLQQKLQETQVHAAVMDTVKTLVATLRHEINNPLGAVLGAAYLLRTSALSTPEQREAADLVESSGKRIKHVLDELCKAVALEPVTKANQKVFHIPGDQPWESRGKP
jgi:DNA-binding NarL/FixJ family response regulator